jgi:hypothetical protein
MTIRIVFATLILLSYGLAGRFDMQDAQHHVQLECPDGLSYALYNEYDMERAACE